MKLEYYRSRSKTRSQRWRWRLLYRGKVIATSGEGYARKEHAQYMANRICGHLLDEPARRKPR